MRIYLAALGALALAGCSSATNTANVQDVAANNMAADEVTEVQDESAAPANTQAAPPVDPSAPAQAPAGGAPVENGSGMPEQR